MQRNFYYKYIGENWVLMRPIFVNGNFENKNDLVALALQEIHLH